MGEAADLEKRAAVNRLAYWQAMYEAAVLANDEVAAAHALQFVREYRDFLASMGEPSK
jgi:hypothetical protein